MLSRLSVRVQTCCPGFLWSLGRGVLPFPACTWHKEMQRASCSDKLSTHCPLHLWAASPASILQNESVARNALGERVVTAKAAHEQVVAALASICCSGRAGLLSGTKPAAPLPLTHRKERTLHTGKRFHPVRVVFFSCAGKCARRFVLQLIKLFHWRALGKVVEMIWGNAQVPANTLGPEVLHTVLLL